jgi:hypothetical protein
MRIQLWINQKLLDADVSRRVYEAFSYDIAIHQSGDTPQRFDVLDSVGVRDQSEQPAAHAARVLARR